jgi:hypothetical protein
MSQEPGDRITGHGDHDTRYNRSGSDMGAGLWVVPTNNEDIALADSDAGNGGLVGITSDPIEDGDYGRVHYRGHVWARVEDDVSAGDELAVPNTATGVDSDADTAGVAAPGGSSGHFAVGDAVDPEGDGNYYAPVLMR